jgi:hypothetical protein
MDTLNIILLVVGAVMFFLAAIGVASRLNFVALGLLAWILVPLISLVSRR